jgi:hypothetical protein
MRRRRAERGTRELRLVVADPRRASVRERIAASVGRLDRAAEGRVMDWIETVADFDAAG